MTRRWSPSEVLADVKNRKCTCPEADCQWHGSCPDCVTLHRYHATIPNCLEMAMEEAGKPLPNRKDSETPSFFAQSGSERHIVLATKGIVWDGERALIVQRSDNDSIDAGVWEFPGGKLDFGETPQDCMRREILEEAGIEAEPERILYAANFFANPNRQTVILTYLCRPLTQGVALSPEHKAYRWATVEEMRQMLGEGIAADMEENRVFDLLPTIRR